MTAWAKIVAGPGGLVHSAYRAQPTRADVFPQERQLDQRRLILLRSSTIMTDALVYGGQTQTVLMATVVYLSCALPRLVAKRMTALCFPARLTDCDDYCPVLEID